MKPTKQLNNTTLDDIPDLGFDLFDDEPKQKDTQPKYANRLMETANKRNQRILNEEEKIYGKVPKFETESYKTFKENERLGKDSNIDMNNFYSKMLNATSTSSNDFFKGSSNKEPQQPSSLKKEVDQKVIEKRRNEFEKQLKEVELKRKDEEDKEKQKLIELAQSKVSKETISEAKKRYLERKKKKLSEF
ncbi:Nuclear speckle splicing regulatory protein 1 N-terminal domain-containing protein [Entamoeba marina]